MSKIIYYIDASALKKSACNRRIDWSIFRGMIPRSTGGWESNYKAGYGTAFHKCYQRIVSHTPTNEAVNFAVNWYRDNFEKYISTGPKEFRTPEHLELVLKTYFHKKHPSDNMVPMGKPTGEPLTEIKFQYPYYEDDFVLYIVGTIDIISIYAGRICVTDHKVTGMSNQDDFFFDFEFNIQSRMYCWMYYMLTGEILPFLVNGIFIKKPTDKSLAKGIFDGVEFRRNTPVDMTLDKLMFFQKWLYAKLDNYVAGIKSGKLSDSFDMAACRSEFGHHCEFFNICRLDSNLHEMVLKSNYQQQNYNPLLFQD